MQYAVPQFIEVEDKVIGPLTTRQFLYLVVGGVFLLIAWALADITLFILLFLITAAVVVPFAFVKINGRPFENFITAAFKFYTTPKVRFWIKNTKASTSDFSNVNKRTKKVSKGQTEEIGDKKFNRSKIQELSQILDMGGATYTSETEEEEAD